MKEIVNQDIINRYSQESYIIEHLKEIDINLHLYQYETGEILINMFEVTSLLQFLVKGAIQIYAIRKDGSKYPVRHIDEFTILGDVELFEDRPSNLLVEAKSTVLCVGVSLNKNRNKLLNDNEFLKFISRSLAKKLMLFSEYESQFATVEERFLYYLREECDNQMITNVEKTAFQMKCSRRQLQRILKKLIDEGLIEKLDKGCYKLVDRGN